MPEIGETLRETRLRRHIDMSDVEAATKIRAKYLRALENEEWDLLPGPAYVKSFLRTYAEYLGLDARMLVEEYRQRYERPSMHDLAPLGPGLGGQRRRRPPALLGPAIALLVGVVVVLAALYALGTIGQPSDEGTAPNGAAAPGKAGRSRTPTRVSLRLIATRKVEVCLVNANGRRLIDNRTLSARRITRIYRSKRFRASFSNGTIRMRVNGRTYDAAGTSKPVGYEMRPGHRPKLLPNSVRARLCR